MNAHKAGFINILGLPNVGKSTLMNALVGERMSIITSKAQTTRHRIMGIYNDNDYQLVFSDTPGFVRETAYKMHEAMNKFVHSCLADADVFLFVTDRFYSFEEQLTLADKLLKTELPIYLVINKCDVSSAEQIAEIANFWTDRLQPKGVFEISAANQEGIEPLMEAIQQATPEHPPFYPKDQLTDRPERFFVTEIIREKIFLNYRQEIPYATEVGIESFQELDHITKIRALIFVERQSQKNIIIGAKGSAIKKMATEARKEIEAFLDSKVYLETFVKVKEDWRKRDSMLRQFGYGS